MATRKGLMPDDPAMQEEEVPVVSDTEDISSYALEPDELPDQVEPEEDLDPATELFEGGPTMGQIELWKTQYGDVYVTSFTPEEHYVWRIMSRYEYRRVVKQLEQQVASGQVGQAEANMNNEEAICELCVLYPPMTRSDMASHPAGVASIISQEVMEASAFVAMEVRQL